MILGLDLYQLKLAAAVLFLIASLICWIGRRAPTGSATVVGIVVGIGIFQPRFLTLQPRETRP